jgi:predicted nuclease of predicted toxin-antitoxin system
VARLYADEQFPRQVLEILRSFGYDVLTVQEAGNAGLPDDEVLDFAVSENRAEQRGIVLTTGEVVRTQIVLEGFSITVDELFA